MKRVPLLAFTGLFLSQAVVAQSVPEGIHRDREGPPSLCGITAANIAAIESIVLNDRAFVEEGSNGQYRVYNRESDFTQFVFPRPTTYSFPVATCRKIESRKDGTFINRELSCDGNREQCDAVFRQFEALDNSLKKLLRN